MELKINQLTLAKIAQLETLTKTYKCTPQRYITTHTSTHIQNTPRDTDTLICTHKHTDRYAHPQTFRKMPHILHTETITHRDTHLHIPTNTDTYMPTDILPMTSLAQLSVKVKLRLQFEFNAQSGNMVNQSNILTMGFSTSQVISTLSDH